MNEPLWTIALALAAGLGLGLVFYGGLYLTVRRLTAVRRPWLWALASFAVRTAAVLAGFVLVAAGSWPRLAAVLVGFVAMRFVTVRLWGPKIENRRHAPREETPNAT